MTKQKPQIGDIFSIKLGDSLYSLGIIIHVSKVFRQSMMIGIFDKLFSSEFEVSTILPDNFSFVDIPNYTSIKVIGNKDNDWYIVCNRTDIVEIVEIPLLVAGNTLYMKDSIVKEILGPDERKKYQKVKGQGKLFVENKLKKHFSIT